MEVCVRDIQELVRGFSIEVTPRGFAKIGDLRACLPAATRVYVTCLAGADFRESVSVVAAILRQGYVAVPHIALRGFAGRKQLGDALRELAAMGVDELLLIAGGQKRPQGTLTSTLDILENGLLAEIPFTAFAFAGHPEGHPSIAEAEIWRALQDKQRFADSAAANVYLLTQFCFLADPVARWCEALAAHGIDLPVHVGIPGVASAKSLLDHARLCGVGDSIRFLRNNASGVRRLIQLTAPDKLLCELAVRKHAGQLGNVKRLHFFPLGGFSRTAAWLQAVCCGAIRTRENGGFSLIDK